MSNLKASLVWPLSFCSRPFISSDSTLCSSLSLLLEGSLICLHNCRIKTSKQTNKQQSNYSKIVTYITSFPDILVFNSGVKATKAECIWLPRQKPVQQCTARAALNHGNCHVARRRMQTSTQPQPTLLVIQVTEGYKAMSNAVCTSS